MCVIDNVSLINLLSKMCDSSLEEAVMMRATTEQLCSILFWLQDRQ